MGIAFGPVAGTVLVAAALLSAPSTDVVGAILSLGVIAAIGSCVGGATGSILGLFFGLIGGIVSGSKRLLDLSAKTLLLVLIAVAQALVVALVWIIWPSALVPFSLWSASASVVGAISLVLFPLDI